LSGAGKLWCMGKHRSIKLNQDERMRLEQIIRTSEEPARVNRRARILLLSDRSQGMARTDQAVAEAVMCSLGRVGGIRKRYLDEGLAGALYDKPRPGAAPKITGEIEAHLGMLACSTPPRGEARWTLRLLAEQLIELGEVDYVSHITVREVLKKTHLSLGG
jgi:putative transposase